MKRRVQWSAGGGAIVLAIFGNALVGPAGAESLSRPASSELIGSPCAEQVEGSEEGCVRIRGHIPASDFVSEQTTVGKAPMSPPFPTSAFKRTDGASRLSDKPALRDEGFLQVRHDELVR